MMNHSFRSLAVSFTLTSRVYGEILSVVDLMASTGEMKDCSHLINAKRSCFVVFEVCFLAVYLSLHISACKILIFGTLASLYCY